MKRKVERKFIDAWMEDNNPNGLFKLAELSGLSPSTITKARVGRSPVKAYTREKLAKALSIDADILFPVVNSNEDKAS